MMIKIKLLGVHDTEESDSMYRSILTSNVVN